MRMALISGNLKIKRALHLGLVVGLALPAQVGTANNAPISLKPAPALPSLPAMAPAADKSNDKAFDKRADKDTANFNPYSALNDPDHRISKDFVVPRSLRLRTRFWFSIYTKYGSHEFVIHHALYPWIIFKVVNTSKIFDNAHINKWKKYALEKKIVHNDYVKIHRALVQLAHVRSQRHLTGLERQLAYDLSHLRGPRRSVYQAAADNIRIQLGQRDFFVSGLTESGRYLPFMEKEFSANGLPVELTRLPFVESSFNIHAESKVGASGIWQLMPHTGREFILVNDQIDERNSPFKSSLVAIELFKQNYRKFKSWPLAITAYNHGWEGLKDGMKKTHSKTLAGLIRRYHKGTFKFASANFYTCFLAALHAQEYHNEIFKGLGTTEPPAAFNVVTLERRTRSKTLIKRLGITKDDLLTYNFDLKHAVAANAFLPKGYFLILPSWYNTALEQMLSKKRHPFREAELHVSQHRSAG